MANVLRKVVEESQDVEWWLEDKDGEIVLFAGPGLRIVGVTKENTLIRYHDLRGLIPTNDSGEIILED